TTTWAETQLTVAGLPNFDHATTGFKLTGLHATAACKACHTGTGFKGLSQTCVSCHPEPKVHLGEFGSNCPSSQSTSSWKDTNLTVANLTNFDHASTGFKLTGVHASTACKVCHKGQGFKGLSQTCVSCHAEPKVHLGKFGTQCASCHSTATWANATIPLAGLANFDHATTGFKLTGVHQSAMCKSCHVGKGFKGLSQTCASCHAEPPAPQVHKYRYGANCTSCHTTTAWTGAKFEHSIFPVTHHSRKDACASCHTDLAHFKTYSCTNC